MNLYIESGGSYHLGPEVLRDVQLTGHRAAIIRNSVLALSRPGGSKGSGAPELRASSTRSLKTFLPFSGASCRTARLLDRGNHVARTLQTQSTCVHVCPCAATGESAVLPWTSSAASDMVELTKRIRKDRSSHQTAADELPTPFPFSGQEMSCTSRNISRRHSKI